MDFLDLAALTIIVQLIFLEGVLSIDNAAVLGAMVAPLPDDRPVPWPRWLQFLAAPTTRMLGYQRDAALKVGLLGAYVGRGSMLLVASVIAENLWVRALGACYLVYLAIDHISNMSHGDEEHAARQTRLAGKGFWSTVLAIELADLAFSIDNVVAAVALSDAFWVIMTGVALGIVTMRFAAGLFSRMIAWEPALQLGAYLLVFAIGLELLLEEFLHLSFPEAIKEYAQFGVSAAILIGTVLVARMPFLRSQTGLWRILIMVFRILRLPFDIVLFPIRQAQRVLRGRASSIEVA